MTDTVATTDPHPFLTRMTQTIGAQVSNDEMLGGSGSDFVMDLMDRILTADSFEEIFELQETGLLSGKDFTNRPFTVMNREAITFRRAGQANVDQGGYPFYAVIEAEELTGDRVTFGCGGKTFMATLFALIERGYFDDQPEGRTLMLVATAAANGSYLTLRPVKRPESTRGKK